MVSHPALIILAECKTQLILFLASFGMTNIHIPKLNVPLLYYSWVFSCSHASLHYFFICLLFMFSQSGQFVVWASSYLLLLKIPYWKYKRRNKGLSYVWFWPASLIIKWFWDWTPWILTTIIRDEITEFVEFVYLYLLNWKLRYSSKLIASEFFPYLWLILV